MNPHMPRRVVQPQRHLQDRFPGLVIHRQRAAFRQMLNCSQDFTHRPVWQPLREVIHFVRRHAKHFGDFAHRQPRVHGDEAADHRHVLRAPALVHIIEQFVSPRPANININVRAIPALFIQEALKIKSPANRAHAGNSQAIQHHRTGCRSSCYRGYAAPVGFLDDVPHQKKIWRQTPFLDDFQFACQPCEHFRAQWPVAFLRAFEAQLPQIRKPRFALRHRELRKNRFAQLQFQVAAVGNLLRRAQQLRMIRK